MPDEQSEEAVSAVDIGTGLHGVFKGGGARGVAYVGALQALDEMGLRFRSVAGSSAGALTAALVACRMPVERLSSEATAGLSSVRWNWFGWLLPWRRRGSLFETDGLQRWLEGHLCNAIGRPTDGSPVTFAELSPANDVEAVELNVVAMDLDRKQPIVFNRTTTPTCSVTAAVVASCAIPVAMPPGRVVVEETETTRQVHRIVDGGAWANYPAFVYTDRSFRAAARLGEVDGPTLGFVLDDEDGPPKDAPRAACITSTRKSYFDRGSGASSGALGTVLTWPVLRVLLLGLTPLALITVVLSWLREQGRKAFPMLDPIPDGLEELAFVLVTSAVTLAAIVALFVLVGQWRLGFEAFDVGLPSLTSALSVGTGVPAWIGTHPEDRVVRLQVTDRLRTTSFDPPATLVDEVIRRAREDAARQLSASFPGVPRTAKAWGSVTSPRAGRRLGRARLGAALLLVAAVARIWFEPDVSASVRFLFPVMVAMVVGYSWMLRKPVPADDPAPIQRYGLGWLFAALGVWTIQLGALLLVASITTRQSDPTLVLAVVTVLVADVVVLLHAVSVLRRRAVDKPPRLSPAGVVFALLLGIASTAWYASLLRPDVGSNGFADGDRVVGVLTDQRLVDEVYEGTYQVTRLPGDVQEDSVCGEHCLIVRSVAPFPGGEVTLLFEHDSPFVVVTEEVFADAEGGAVVMGIVLFPAPLLWALVEAARLIGWRRYARALACGVNPTTLPNPGAEGRERTFGHAPLEETGPGRASVPNASDPDDGG